jgi:hypothetical protein
MAALSRANTLEEAARRIAERIGDRTVRIDNRSSLPASALSRLSALLKTERDGAVAVTVSENAAGYLLVASIGEDVAIVPFDYDHAPRRRIALTITPVMISAAPVLDALITDERLIALEPSQVVLYRRANGTWQPSLAAALNLPHPMPRDPRGRLEGSPQAFHVAVPGANCTGSATAQAITVTCVEALDNGWIPGRNVRRDAQPPGAPGWGSDATEVALPCGRATIATRATADGEWSDQLTAFETGGGQALSEAAPVAGRVTALWPGTNPVELTMTTHTRSGSYELSRVTAACVD